MRARCAECPEWRDSGNWDEAKGRFARIAPQRGHAQDEAAKARAAALAAGANSAEARRAYAETEERVLREHDVADRPELWEWHVLGNDPRGKMYHRGVYSHREQDHGLDVCWDIDKGQDPLGKARVIRDKLRELGLGASVYENSSWSGNGAHVRLCHDLAPSWLRYAFGRRLLEACGFTPGNDPAKGQTESFPKQEDADYVGNMIGLPCALPRMANGATCVLDEHLHPVRDPGWTAWRLAAVRAASLAELHAAARALGLDPLAKPEPPKPLAVTKPGERVTVQLKKGAGAVTYRKGSDVLGTEVRARVPMLALLQQLGAVDKGGEKFCCPAHREPPDGNPSFHVYTATRAGDVHDRYQCFGDCKGTARENGDVIALYAAVTSTTYRAAKLELARQAGINPNDFKDTVEASPQVNLSARAFNGLAEWCAQAFDLSDKPLFAAKAMMRVMYENGVSYERVAATVWKGLGKGRGWDRAACYANAAEALDAIGSDKPRAGASWLKRKIGLIQVREFARQLIYATQGSFTEIYKRTVGFERYWNGSVQRNFLRETYLSIPEPYKRRKKSWAPPPDHEDPPESALRAMIRRPCSCRHFANIGKDTLDGHTVRTASIACNVDIMCVACLMVRALGAYSLVTGAVKPVGEDGKLSDQWDWGKMGPYYAVTVELPIGCEIDFEGPDPLKDRMGHREGKNHVDGLNKRVNKKAEPKIMAASCNPVTGQRRMIYIVREKVGQATIAGQITTYLRVHKLDIKFERTETVSSRRAASWIFDAMLDVALHSEHLARCQDTDALLAWCAWWKGKQKVVSRSKRGLPWPSREVVRKAVQVEAGDFEDEYPGQVVRYDVVHRETGYVIARGLENPASIDEAASIAGRDDTFGAFQAAKQEAKRTVSA